MKLTKIKDRTKARNLLEIAHEMGYRYDEDFICNVLQAALYFDGIFDLMELWYSNYEDDHKYSLEVIKIMEELVEDIYK